MSVEAVVAFVSLWWDRIDLAITVLAWFSVPSVVVNRRGRPVAAISWILALVSLPIPGLLLWWLFGRRHLERKRRTRYNKHLKVARRLEDLRDRLNPPSTSSQLLPLTKLPDELDGVFQPSSGNAVQLLTDGKLAFEVMDRDILDAQHHIHVLFYIWRDDETGRHFRDMLVDKARQGVEVRVLCDAFGGPLFARRFFRALKNAGAQVAQFMPPRLLSRSPRLNFRNHRKIVVVDGRYGIIGGFNIADEYRKTWRDMGVRIDGPAVDQLQEIFADDWYYATNEDLAAVDYFGCWKEHSGETAVCATIANGPDTRLSSIHDALFIAINQAKKRLFISTPYLIPTIAIRAALRAALYRGVDVRILVPANSDVPLVRYAARSYYPELLDVGARIFEYQPAMLHAKVLVFDDDLVLIGSANMDSRSFKLNFEASCFVSSLSFNEQAAVQFARDLDQSVEIKQHDLDALPAGAKLLDATAHLLSPLL